MPRSTRNVKGIVMARKRLVAARKRPEYPGMLRLVPVPRECETLPDTPEFRAACAAYTRACQREVPDHAYDPAEFFHLPDHAG